jgi:L-iditol 2-dehydrogenase
MAIIGFKPPRTMPHKMAGVVEDVVKGACAVILAKGVAQIFAPPMKDLGMNGDVGHAQYLAPSSRAIRNGNANPTPKGVPFEEAASVEPFFYCVNRQEELDTGAHESVLIIGAGPIGLIHSPIG